MKYPSDISRAQFNKIAPLLEGARKKTKPNMALVEKDRLLGWKSTVALWKNRERLILSSIGMMQLAFIRILVRRS